MTGAHDSLKSWNGKRAVRVASCFFVVLIGLALCDGQVPFSLAFTNIIRRVFGELFNTVHGLSKSGPFVDEIFWRLCPLVFSLIRAKSAFRAFALEAVSQFQLSSSAIEGLGVIDVGDENLLAFLDRC